MKKVLFSGIAILTMIAVMIGPMAITALAWNGGVVATPSCTGVTVIATPEDPFWEDQSGKDQAKWVLYLKSGEGFFDWGSLTHLSGGVTIEWQRQESHDNGVTWTISVGVPLNSGESPYNWSANKPGNCTTPTPTVTSTTTFTVTPTMTRTVTTTTTLTPTSTSTVTKTVTMTPSMTSTSTSTSTATATDTATVTKTATNTATATETGTPTMTVTVTKTSTMTSTITVTPRNTPTDTATATATSTEVKCNDGYHLNDIGDGCDQDPTPTPTGTYTLTPVLTDTATSPATDTATATIEVTITPTVTESCTDCVTVTSTATLTPGVYTATPTPENPTGTSVILTVTPTGTARATKTATVTKTPLPPTDSCRTYLVSGSPDVPSRLKAMAFDEAIKDIHDENWRDPFPGYEHLVRVVQDWIKNGQMVLVGSAHANVTEDIFRCNRTDNPNQISGTDGQTMNAWDYFWSFAWLTADLDYLFPVQPTK